jgi:hypothetical protein
MKSFFDPINGSADKFELNSKHGGEQCDRFYEDIDYINGKNSLVIRLSFLFLYLIILSEKYDCADYEDRFEELQSEMDLHAGYYGCFFELCGLTAGDEFRVENSGVNSSVAAAPLFLTLLFWLFK